MQYFFAKMGWATFWAIFSQTHLVTLLLGNRRLPSFFCHWKGPKNLSSEGKKSLLSHFRFSTEYLSSSQTDHFLTNYGAPTPHPSRLRA
jgi:hypothetical protein